MKPIVFQHKIFPSIAENGHRQFRVDRDGDNQASHMDGVLVVQTEQGWAPVETLESSIDRASLETSYGCWHDRDDLYTKGPKHFDPKRDRLRDGVVQEDEVYRFGPERHAATTHVQVGTEIVVTADEGPVMEVHQVGDYFGYRGSDYPLSERQQDLNRRVDLDSVSKYNWDDSNWKVAIPQAYAERNPFK